MTKIYIVFAGDNEDYYHPEEHIMGVCLTRESAKKCLKDQVIDVFGEKYSKHFDEHFDGNRYIVPTDIEDEDTDDGLQEYYIKGFSIEDHSHQ